MSIYSNRLVLAVLVGLGLLFMTPAMADGPGKIIKLKFDYAGRGIDTPFEVVDEPPGFPVPLRIGVADAKVKGAGGATVAITAEFVPLGLPEPQLCEMDPKRPNGPYQKFGLVYSAAVLTFRDLSQLWAVSNPGEDPEVSKGVICLNELGAYYGQVDGRYIAGTGRFEGAIGKFESPFEGQFLDPVSGFRAISGSVKAKIQLP